MSEKKILLSCFAAMDLTSLHPDDTPQKISAFVEKVNQLENKFPSYPLPASICVFSNLAETVREHIKNPALHVTAVSACFPTAQSFLEVKLREIELAIAQGAQEIDVVLPLNSFLAGDMETCAAELKAFRAACKGGVILKVILETGVLGSEELIYKASMLAMDCGADFIKTSTGKVEINATPFSARVMCRAIKDYYQKTSRKVGFKAAGGISTAEQAVEYYSIVKEILGEEWTGKSLFRLGVSKLGNSLLSALEGSEIKYF